MNQFHNVRNSEGKFTRRVNRASDGKFAPALKIVPGRLYEFKGAVVRALQKDSEVGLRLVSMHKALFGYVPDSQLQKINRRKVQTYLAGAK